MLQESATLGDFWHELAQVAANFADSPAVSWQGEVLSYRALHHLIQQASAAIQQRQQQDITPIPVIMPRNPALYGLLLGIMQSGRAYCYLSPDTRLAVQQQIIAQLASTFVIGPAYTDLSTILANAGTAVPCEKPAHAAPGCLVHSSGSTNVPKLMFIPVHHLHHHINQFKQTMQLHPTDRVGLLSSPQYTAANAGYYGALITGACLCPFALEAHGIAACIEWLQTEKISVLHLTPSLFRLIAHYAPQHALQTIRAVKLGGEAAYVSDVELFKQKFSKECLLVNGLGLSEVGGNIAHFVIRHDTDLSATAPHVPVGKVLPGFAVSIAEDSGEIVIQSPWLANAMQLVHSNDLGYFLPNNVLVHLGRKNRVIKRNGLWVDLNWIEATAMQLANVKRAVAYWTALEEGAAVRLFVCIELMVPGSEQAALLLKKLQHQLPAHMLPQVCFLFDVMPLTATGKIDNQTLLASLKTRTREKKRIKPRHFVEKQLLPLWARVLNQQAVSIDDNFFTLGGDSLSCLALCACLKREYQYEVTPDDIRTHPTIAQLSAFLQARTSCKPLNQVQPIYLHQTKTPLASWVFIPGGRVSAQDLTLMAGLLPLLHPLPNVLGLTLAHLPDNAIETLAQSMVDTLRTTRELHAPIVFAECIAGVLALEVARLLQRVTGEAPLLILLNPWHPRPQPDTQSLLKKHDPLPYAGMIHVIFAHDQIRTPEECSRWWQQKSTYPIQMHTVCGDNQSYIREHALGLAKKIVDIIGAR